MLRDGHHTTAREAKDAAIHPLAQFVTRVAVPAIESLPWDARAEVLFRRTYSRPKDDGRYETWQEMIDRVIRHQAWLWTRVITRSRREAEAVFESPDEDVGTSLIRVLPAEAVAELLELRDLMQARAALLAGRTLWLGGTETARAREVSQFNCAYLEIDTVYDLVDGFWLLLNGCGVGFRPVEGSLFGFATYIPKLTIIPSQGQTQGGRATNQESYDRKTKVWTIEIGDSAEAWAKALGKLMAGKFYGCGELVLDFSQVRAPGSIIKGFGWHCQGYEALANGLRKIATIMNHHAGRMLPFGAIHDIMNLVGTTLSSRRSAQIALCDYGADNWREFAQFKTDYYLPEVNRPWREQSNNTLDFHRQPTKEELEEVFELMVASGGSEPGFRNARAAKRRAPYSRGQNPCAEILLGNRSLCNLVEVNVAHPHHSDFDELLRTIWMLARANMRQSCVDLRDGILQRSWHEGNQNLHLCGVGLTGLIQRADLLTPDTLQTMRNHARAAANSMADELELPRPKAVTTVKPSGTLSKVMQTTEGCHRPLGKYILNSVEFSRYSRLVQRLADAGHRVTAHPTKPDAVLVAFPVAFENVPFDTLEDGREANLEPAVAQLDRYLTLLTYWCDHNVSCTVSYEPAEIPAIIDWLQTHWDEVIGVSFLYSENPQMRAEDLGYAYLPQEVITEEEYREYCGALSDIVLDGSEIDALPDQECPTGACPVR